MLQQISPHRFLSTTLPRRPFGALFSVPRHTARGWEIPGFALELFGLRWEDAAGVRSPVFAPQDPFALQDMPNPLWKHQAEDALSMLSGSWGEWAATGVGKTQCVLAAYRILLSEGKVDGMIILGPGSASHAWVGECSDTHKWGMESALVSEKSRTKGLPTEKVLFCNYDKAWREPYSSRLLGLLRTKRWVLVLDELHVSLGPSSKRFACVELWSRFPEYLWALTGTPVANYPDRLWGAWRLLTKEATSYEEWCLWFKKDEYGNWHTDRLKALGRYMKRFSRVRTRKEVAPWLPATTIRTIPIRLVGEQRRRYEELLEDSQTPGLSSNAWLGCIQRLLGVCSHPDLGKGGGFLTGSESKLETLLEILEGLGDEKVVVWSWHPGTLAWLARKLPQRSVQYHGGTSEAERVSAISAFENGDAQVFLGNPSAAGAGINLGKAVGRIFWDASYHATQYTQAQGRIERGLRYSGKFEIRLVAEGTVEAHAWGAIANKLDLSQIILRGGPAAKHHAKSIVKLWKS